ncbi:LysR family transcriptional regulator [Sulfobacillus harzensis]|uniref:LysR family transcriptional regulator n=1 Tax=Sulfobacillus harzensis TaxID=2729629 RepID=A0A7Y0L2Z4_9FIRM|nr:LysR family transcriptional regulator [Sulfobacillus harzensis]NMP22341.1 LysR family transcriptional regulator [Sulfobacillus harzensis]
MTFEDLELFWALAEKQSVTEAARMMQVSQPTASRRLKAMEEELGAPLLDRDAHPLSLTPLGFVFLDFADEVLQKLRALKLNAGFNHSTIGTLTVATSSSPAARLVTRWMAEFVKANPGVRLRLQEMNSQAVESHVASAQSDIGFMGVKPTNSKLSVLAIGEDEIVLIVPRRAPYASLPHPAPWDAVRTLPFIARADGSGTEQTVLEALRAKNWLTPQHVALEVDTGSALIDAVESGLGIGFVSRELLFRRELDKSTIWPIKHLRIVRPFYLVFQPERLQAIASARAFLRFAHLHMPHPANKPSP